MNSSFQLKYNVGVCLKSHGGVEGSQVLDGGEEELMKTQVISRKKKKTVLGDKRRGALKSHAEAEKRRRDKINGHLSTLRNFVPCTNNKMDKATLLGKVINQLRVMRNQALEATKEMLIPSDVDEVTVVPYNDLDKHDEFYTFKASLCCEQKPHLILDIRQAIDTFKFAITKSEISTLQNRLKMMLIISASKEQMGGYCNMEKLANKIQHALFSVVDKNSTLQDYLPKASFLNKRPRVCP